MNREIKEDVCFSNTRQKFLYFVLDLFVDSKKSKQKQSEASVCC